LRVAEIHGYLILIAAGIAASTLNVLAGGGSFLTLPILIFLGLPTTVANGTNRFGVLMQNLGAVWGFHKAGVLYWRWALTASAPALLGSAIGSWAALHVGDDLFRRILAVVMIVVTLATLLAPDPQVEANVRSARSWVVGVGFFVVGLYGGFLQAGVGFLVLAITTWARLDLVRGNAIKVVSVFLLTLLALVIFIANGAVHWPMGLALAAGNAIGSQIGVRLAVTKGHRWLKGVVTVTVIAFAIRLWLEA
jgi:uncharacterized membrane protein YfcA